MSAGQVPAACVRNALSVLSRPPCQEKNQLWPSVVAPCDRVRAAAPRNSSLLTSFQVGWHAGGLGGGAAVAVAPTAPAAAIRVPARPTAMLRMVRTHSTGPGGLPVSAP